MNIQPVSLTIEGFRSFGKKQEFKFPTVPGLCALQGVNEAEPEMGSNGSGKSSIWEALYYCLYGKSTMGLSSKDLQNWNEKDRLKVRFDFLANGAPAFISRTPKPVMMTSLMTASIEKQVSQQELDAWLGMSGDVFVQAVLAGQFTNLFLDLAPIEKLKFVSALADLSRWERYKDLADRKHATITAKKAQEEVKVSSTEALIASTNKTLDLYRDKSASWELERTERVEGLNAEIKRVYLRKETMDKALKAFQEAHSPEDESLLRQGISKNNQQNQRVREDIDSLTTEIANLSASSTTYKANLKRFEGLISKGYLCPTCEQKASPEHIQAETEAIQPLLAEVQTKFRNASTKKDKLVVKLRQIEAQRNSLESRIANISQEERKYQSKVNGMQTEIQSVVGEITRIKDKIESAKTETNQYEDMFRKQLEEVKQHNEKLREAQARFKQLAYQEGMQTFWRKGFREIQLFLLSEAVNQLELSYNTALSSLGMPDWKISIKVENENKSGGVSNKFHVLIYTPTHDEPIPWESFSGGEKQRLRLACAFGTFDLVSQLTGVFWKLEVWDEPTQHLSEKGEESLLNYLRQRSQILQKTIYVIDHRGMKNADYDFTTTVRKDSSGSYIE